jgi:hypothetical protein
VQWSNEIPQSEVKSAYMGRVKAKKRTANLRQCLASQFKDVSFDRLFDDIERADSSPKKGEESYFRFYNRSARSVMANVRSFIEVCFSNYPAEERNSTRKRLRSGNDSQFESTIFELILHEALINQGCVLTPHPTLPNGSDKRPDFLVVTGEGERFYLEATVATAVTSKEGGANARRA